MARKKRKWAIAFKRKNKYNVAVAYLVTGALSNLCHCYNGIIGMLRPAATREGISTRPVRSVIVCNNLIWWILSCSNSAIEVINICQNMRKLQSHPTKGVNRVNDKFQQPVGEFISCCWLCCSPTLPGQQ